jgi:hypothetical protein
MACCGDLDCRAIEDRDIRELADGGFQFHICESATFNYSSTTLDWRWVCFFAPPRMM